MQSDTFKISNPTITYTNYSDLCEIPDKEFKHFS